jgi:hypothetical protein
MKSVSNLKRSVIPGLLQVGVGRAVSRNLYANRCSWKSRGALRRPCRALRVTLGSDRGCCFFPRACVISKTLQTHLHNPNTNSAHCTYAGCQGLHVCLQALMITFDVETRRVYPSWRIGLNSSDIPCLAVTSQGHAPLLHPEPHAQVRRRGS